MTVLPYDLSLRKNTNKFQNHLARTRSAARVRHSAKLKACVIPTEEGVHPMRLPYKSIQKSTARVVHINTHAYTQHSDSNSLNIHTHTTTRQLTYEMHFSSMSLIDIVVTPTPNRDMYRLAVGLQSTLCMWCGALIRMIICMIYNIITHQCNERTVAPQPHRVKPTCVQGERRAPLNAQLDQLYIPISQPYTRHCNVMKPYICIYI